MKKGYSLSLEGYIKLKKKKYYTTIPIEILRLSRLIEKSEGAEIMQFIWKRFTVLMIL